MKQTLEEKLRVNVEGKELDVRQIKKLIVLEDDGLYIEM